MKFERLEHSQIKASFTVSKEEFASALDEAFVICNEKVTIKGFRKGKAPKKLYLEHYGEESLYADAVDCAVNKKMRDELLPNEEIQIASQPQLDVDFSKVGPEGFDFNLIFDTMPEVKLGAYSGLEVAKTDDEPTATELEQESDRLLHDLIKNEAKDGALALGDTAKFDFVGTKDGVEFPGGKAENYELKIGSGQFIPGFEEGMVGMNKGEERDINVTFPENYQEKSLAGQPCVFHVTLHEITTPVKPELTDEVVQGLKIENVNTVEEFNKHIHDDLANRKAQYNSREMENKLLDMACENATIDLPKSFINDKANQLRANAEAQAKQYNIPFELFLQFSGVNKDDFEKQVLAEAEKQVKMEFVLTEIAKVEKLIPTDEEVVKAMEDYAKAYNMKVADLEKRYGKAPFVDQIATNNAVKFVVEHKIVK